MKLSNEWVQTIKAAHTNGQCVPSRDIDKWDCSYDCVFDKKICENIRNLCDTIEALLQENEQLKEAFKKYGDAAISKGFLFKEVNLDNVRKLKQENERLQAQNRVMRDALEKVNKCLFSGYCKPFDIGTPVKEALRLAPAEYHNPADVAAIQKAKEALEYYSNTQNWDLYMHQNCMVAKPDKAREALTAIKAGEKDV